MNAKTSQGADRFPSGFNQIPSMENNGWPKLRKEIIRKDCVLLMNFAELSTI